MNVYLNITVQTVPRVLVNVYLHKYFHSVRYALQKLSCLDDDVCAASMRLLQCYLT